MMRRPVLRMLWPALLAWLGSVGCAAFGLPDFPPELRHPPRVPGAVFVVYDPYAVLAFGHTGLILHDPAHARYLRYDQYASSEIAYGLRVRRGTARFWEAVTSRLPAIFATTKEVVTRRAASSLAGLVAPGEYVVPVPRSDLNTRAILEAAERRFRAAFRLEQATAPAYSLLSNSCQHFLTAIMGAGGPIPDLYFPKHFVAAYLERYKASKERQKRASRAPVKPTAPDWERRLFPNDFADPPFRQLTLNKRIQRADDSFFDGVAPPWRGQGSDRPPRRARRPAPARPGAAHRGDDPQGGWHAARSVGRAAGGIGVRGSPPLSHLEISGLGASLGP